MSAVGLRSPRVRYRLQCSMVAPIVPEQPTQPEPRHLSRDEAEECLRAAFGEPTGRSRAKEPRWHVIGPRGGAWFELHERDNVPIVMIDAERGCSASVCDVLFIELRSSEDVAILARGMGVVPRDRLNTQATSPDADACDRHVHCG
jgi:hypothetical protein